MIRLGEDSSRGVRMHFLFSPFMPDSRANRLKDFAIYMPQDGVAPDRWLYLCGPDEVAKQFLMLGGCEREAVPEEHADAWSHRLHFARNFSQSHVAMAMLLKDVLSLTTKQHLDCAIALDWYKIPPLDNTPRWPNTPSGELVYRAKYYSSGSDKTTARRALIEKYVEILDGHPLYRNCNAIATVPGHMANGASFGETLAADVAKSSGKHLIVTQSPGGPRPAAKETTAPINDGHFRIPFNLRGDVIVLDDVYRSGTTMNAVAKAVRTAGARRALGIAAVRTLRN